MQFHHGALVMVSLLGRHGFQYLASSQGTSQCLLPFIPQHACHLVSVLQYGKQEQLSNRIVKISLRLLR